MDVTNAMAEFVISGDRLDPEAINRELRLVPTRAYTKGELIPRPGVIRSRGEKSFEAKFSVWQIETEYEPTQDIRRQVEEIHALLEGKEAALLALKEEYDLSFDLGVVIKVEKGLTPVISLDKLNS